MAWSAQQISVPAEAWLMFISSLLWIVAYDTEYAMVDRDDDLKIGVKSTAILFGDLDRLMIGILQASALLGFLLLGIELGCNTSTTLGLRSWQAYLLIRVGLFATGSGTLALGFATSGSACACYWALYSSYRLVHGCYEASRLLAGKFGAHWALITRPCVGLSLLWC